jgi:hypothetical protein
MALILLSFAVGCRGRESTVTRRPADAAVPTTPEELTGKTPEELNKVALAGAHILVTYSGSKPFASNLALPPTTQPRTRTREEARALALALTEAARRAPSRFAELARTSSEDIYTVPYGGRFGVTGPAGLPDEVAVAVLSMRENEIRGPVESPVGFHVVERLPLPSPIDLSGRSLVVAYTGSPEAPADDATHVVTRTRDQARQRANELLAQVRRAPDRFADLVRRESDGLRAVDGGYLGRWSSNDPLIRSPHLTLPLLALEVGQISDVVETPFGFQIFQRLPPTAPERRAATALVLDFAGPTGTSVEGTAPTATRDGAIAQAQAIVRDLRRASGGAAARFESAGHQAGVRLVVVPSWSRGDQHAAIDVALDHVPLGGITDPIVLADRVLVVRRDSP